MESTLLVLVITGIAVGAILPKKCFKSALVIFAFMLVIGLAALFWVILEPRDYLLWSEVARKAEPD